MKKAPAQFQKFSNKKSNAAIKEEFKQEKRKYKKERADFFENKKKEERTAAARTGSEEKGIRPSSVITIKRKESKSEMPLNKYIAHSGVTARREAAEMVKKGLVKVNGKIITEPGLKIASTDEVHVNGKKIFLAKNLVYILLNKPKDYITTTDDDKGRKTVLDIVKKSTTERVYPVGRLDRNTTGVLLLTNDGELAQQLTHPASEVVKLYHASLEKPLSKKDFDRIAAGITLEDGIIKPDAIAYTDAKDKSQIGIEIHSGRNRIVRRIFEAVGNEVKYLDRVTFAGLTKKNVERGKYRFLNEKEVRDLKHFSKGKKNSKGVIPSKSPKEEQRTSPRREGQPSNRRREGQPTNPRRGHLKP